MTASSSVQTPSYSAVAKTLHWTIALLIIGMLVLGWTMGGAPPSIKFKLFQLHKSFGITILVLSVLRLLWRLTHHAPALPITMPAWEKFAANATHILFYVLIIAMPFSGWLMVSASPMNIPTILFWTIPWPNVPGIADMANKEQIGHLSSWAHGKMAFTMSALIILHIGAALKHHFIVKDDIVLRMAPRFLTKLLNLIRGQK